jgi:membrane protein implicated in regulation of membrane protease activity
MPGKRRYQPLDYHDPTAGIGGAPPARSALGLRLILAMIGLVTCAAGAVAFATVDEPVATVLLAVLAAAAAVDIVTIVRRRRVERGDDTD